MSMSSNHIAIRRVIRIMTVMALLILLIGMVTPAFCIQPVKAQGISYTVATAGAVPYSTAFNSQRKLAITSDGHIHAVYHRLDSNGIFQIYHAESSDEGKTWAEEPVTSGNYNQEYPSIAADSQNNLHIVWQGKTSESPDITQIRYRKGTPSGWGGILDLTHDTGWHQDYPVIAVDSHDYLHVAWHKTENNNGYWCSRGSKPDGCGPLYYTKFTGSWSEPIRIGINDQNNEIYPSIAIDSNDYINVAWLEGGYQNAECWHSAFRSFTTSWQPIDTFECGVGWFSSAVDSKGNVHLGSTAAPNYPSIIVLHWTRTGSVWGSPETVYSSSTDLIAPSIAMENNDYLHVIWPEDGNIKHREYTTSWQDTETIISDTTSSWPNLLWAWNPQVNGKRPNVLQNGYAFLYTSGQEIKFYSEMGGTVPQPQNHPPILVNPGDKTITDGQTLAFTLSASDPDSSDILSYSFSPTLSGATLNPSTGEFSWTPSSGNIGDHTITFAVTDNGNPQLSDSKTININVACGGILEILDEADIGGKIILTGTNPSTDKVYLFLIGPQLPNTGVKLDDTRISTTSGHPNSFVIADVNPDGTWTYEWDTQSEQGDTLTPLVPGIYSIIALSEPLNAQDYCAAHNIKTFNINLVLPDEFSWKNWKGNNWMTPVHSQDHWGACWAFATIGSVEAKYNIEQSQQKNLDLSEWDLHYQIKKGVDEGVELSSGINSVYNVIQISGIVDEACNPFNWGSKKLLDQSPNIPWGRCLDFSSHLWKINQHDSASLLSIDEIKQKIMYNGPITIVVPWTSEDVPNTYHAIVLVGWDDAENVWLFKNSWGKSYEDQGYGKIPFTGSEHSDIITMDWSSGVYKVGGA